jgi:hypothetical protein
MVILYHYKNIWKGENMKIIIANSIIASIAFGITLCDFLMWIFRNCFLINPMLDLIVVIVTFGVILTTLLGMDLKK